MADDPAATPTPQLTLNNGVTVPQLGYGVFQIPPEEAHDAVREALTAGYRLVDTAAAYRNEEGVGTALAESGIPREELFVTTKLWNADHGRDAALRAFDTSMEKLGLETLDLYLIHWPLPKRDDYVETWRALEELYRSGRIRAIGVSNFTVHHLNRLADETDIRPAVNQVELHPRFPQTELRDYHREHEIVTEAWSPIGQGGELLEDPTLTEVASRVGRSPAQVVLRWHVQLGNLVIPKSVTPERIRANIEVFDFELSEDDMTTISGMQTGERLGPDPEVFDLV